MRGLAKLRDLYISIHAAREGGDRIVRFKVCVTVISIHAAREGGDIRVIHFAVYLDNFNPRRP